MAQMHSDTIRQLNTNHITFSFHIQPIKELKNPHVAKTFKDSPYHFHQPHF